MRTLIHFAALASVFSPALARSAHLLIPSLSTDRDASTDVQSKLHNVEPSTARLILAGRLGVSEYHEIAGSDEQAIEALNTYGGHVKGSMFGKQQEDEEARQRVLVVVEDAPEDAGFGTEEETALLPQSIHLTRVAISNPPSLQDTHHLIQDIVSQSRYLTWAGRHSKYMSDTPFQYNEWWNHFAKAESSLFYSESGLTVLVGKYNELHPEGSLYERLVYLEQWAELNSVTLTILLTEPESNSVFSKRSASSPWGAYHMSSRRSRADPVYGPDAPDAGSRPGVETAPSDIFIDAEQQTEAPQRPTRARPSSSSSTRGSSPSKTPSRKPITAPSGILPPVYPSLESCQKTTHNCSGHGSCGLSARYKDGSDVISQYQCMCNATVQKMEGGSKKTTRWAGPACQKKDVSEAFWLIAGFTVVLISLVGWGIGLLFNMGAEELPGVIGAGVAGPKAGR